MAIESQVETEASYPSFGAPRRSSERAKAAARKLSDPEIYEATKRRLLELLRILARSGPLSLDEVSEAIGGARDLPPDEDPEVLQGRLTELSAETRFVRAFSDLFELETSILERAVRQERTRIAEREDRIEDLEDQLRDARRTIVRLVAASRDSLRNLNRIRGDFLEGSYAQEALDPLVADLQAVAQTVLELHALARVRGAGLPDGHGPARP